MSDLSTIIRDYYESVSEPVTVDEILTRPVGRGSVRPLQPQRLPQQRRRWLVALGAAVAVLVLIGGVVLALGSLSGEPGPPAGPGEVTSTTGVQSSPVFPTYGWTRIEVAPPNDDCCPPWHIVDVIWTGDNYLAAGVAISDHDQGQQPTMWRSADGTEWTRVNHDFAPVADGLGTAVHSVTVGGPGFVAVGVAHDADPGAAGAVWISEDGEQWVQVPDDDAVFAAGQSVSMNAVTEGDTGLIAVGRVCEESVGDGCPSRPAVWVSPDGATWTRSLVGAGLGELTGVAAFGSELVAIGRTMDAIAPSNSTAWISSDGASWTQIESPTFSGPGDQVMSGVAAGRNGLVIVGASYTDTTSRALVWHSRDGRSWTLVSDEATFPEGQEIEVVDVVATGSGFVAVGGIGDRPGIWTSPDGVAWTVVAHPELFDGFIAAIAAGPDQLTGLGAGHGPAVSWVGTS